MRIIPVVIFFLLSSFSVAAQQYTLNGAATQINCHCYILTQDVMTSSGSVWNNNRIDLDNSFDFVFDVNLGSKDANGADGIAFVLQPISTSVGATGSGLGFLGIVPSIGVTLDTWQNVGAPDNDPTYDHIAIQRNGDLDHFSANNLAGPVPISALSNNVEDGIDHKLRIIWDATTKTLTTFFDGIERLSIVNDLVNTTFGGDPLVFWGFTGSTGGSSNLQTFCTSLSPAWNFLPAQNRCINEPVQFFDNTISFTTIAEMCWDFGDYSPLDCVNTDPLHTYTAPGAYTVIQTVTGADGCEERNEQTVIIGDVPVASFTISDSCVGNTITFTSTSSAAFGAINNWYWELDESNVSVLQSPMIAYAAPDLKNIKLAVRSEYGCPSDTLYDVIDIYARPEVDFTFTDSVCIGTASEFFGEVVFSSHPVTHYMWQLSDATTYSAYTQNASYVFSTPGVHTANFFATSTAAGNCLGGRVKEVFVADKPRAAIRAIAACQNQPVQLLDSSYTTDNLAVTGWWWDLGNGQFSVEKNPVVSFSAAGQASVRLVATNSLGCISDTLDFLITVSPKPLAKFSVSESLCNTSLQAFYDSSEVADGSVTGWEWIYNNAVFSTQQQASGQFPVGNNTIALVVTSENGCRSDTAYQSFVVKAKPEIVMDFSDACKFSEVIFSAEETATSIGIASWHWDFGDGNGSTANPAAHIYTRNGAYPVKLYAISLEGCSSDTLEAPVTIYGTDAFAGNDTLTAAMHPVQLRATGGLSYEWTPAIGLSATDIPDPVAINDVDRTYYLKVYTPEGCESYDTITITIYKGPDIYVPTAFTPNNDGKNDMFKTTPVGIDVFEYLAVYNRYGNLVFKTNDYTKGWDGKMNGKEQNSGVYVWMVSGIDFNGNRVFRKGTVTLIR